MRDVELMPGIYPAIVKSYDQATRTCRVEIPEVTRGGDVYPEAKIAYPIGDKSKAGIYATEVEILAGDMVWVEFIGSDSRYPIITGYRNPKTGNSVDDHRRYHHQNIQLIADDLFRINVGESEIKLTPTEIRLTIGDSEIIMNSTTVTINATNAIINANTDINGSTLTHNNKSISSTHTHGGVTIGTGNTGAPN